MHPPRTHQGPESRADVGPTGVTLQSQWHGSHTLRGCKDPFRRCRGALGKEASGWLPGTCLCCFRSTALFWPDVGVFTHFQTILRNDGMDFRTRYCLRFSVEKFSGSQVWKGSDPCYDDSAGPRYFLPVLPGPASPSPPPASQAGPFDQCRGQGAMLSRVHAWSLMLCAHHLQILDTLILKCVLCK